MSVSAIIKRETSEMLEKGKPRVCMNQHNSEQGSSPKLEPERSKGADRGTKRNYLPLLDGPRIFLQRPDSGVDCRANNFSSDDISEHVSVEVNQRGRSKLHHLCIIPVILCSKRW